MAAMALVLLVAKTEVASACGGFFCSNTQVDQTAEQIIFAREGDKATTYIQIRYQGSVPDFGWIVPVREVPEKLELASAQLFNELNTMTAPVFIRPRLNSDSSGCDGPSIGCAMAEASSTKMRSPNDSSVDVISQGTFGKFNYVVLSADTSDDLYKWLSDNQYNVPEAARGIVQEYLDEKSKFVALKLQPDATVFDIQPVKITFPKWDPCVPLRLTRIAAQANMGVLVYVLGDSRAVPQKFASITVDDKKIRFVPDGFGPTNYRTLVTEAADEAGGHGFITEFAGPTDSLRNGGGAETQALLDSAPYLTRLYTTISPDEMTLDPEFAFSTPGQLGDVSNIHVLGEESLGVVEGWVGTLFLAVLTTASVRRRKSRS